MTQMMAKSTRQQRQATSVSRLEDSYIFVKPLGEGGEGEVKEYADKNTGALFAVKFRRRKDRGRPLEVEILKGFPRNRLVVQFVECYDIDLKNCAIVLEHCAGGDLHNFYKRQEKSVDQAAFSERFMWSVFKQIAGALAFIHKDSGKKKHPVVHCDIKPHNILIKTLGTKPDFSSISIRLADFGLAIYHNASARSPSCLGSPAYWAPEVDWEDVRYTPAVDVWAMGAVMHLLAHGFPPLEDPQAAAKKEGANPFSYRRESAFKSIHGESNWQTVNAERTVVPIGLAPNDQTGDSRRKRPTPQYSSRLSKCFNMALTADAPDRPTASAIAKKIRKLERRRWWHALC